MGYIIRNIAEYTDPVPLTIVSRPNFFKVKGFISQAPVQYTRTIRFKQELYATDANADAATIVVFLPDGNSYNIRPTLDVAKIGGTTFYVDTDATRTAENIKNALLSLDYIANNFDVNIYSVNTLPYTGMQNTLQITSKGQGTPYNLVWKNLSGAIDPPAFWALTGGTPSFNYDMLTNENETVVIEVDVYTGSSVLLGLNDFPDNAQKLGTLVTTLKKNYRAGNMLWFDLNALFSKSTQFNFDKSASWFNTDTLIKYRFDVKLRDNKGTYTIYRSNLISALNGFAELEAPLIDLYTTYVFTGAFKVSLLTNQPQIPYVPGQPVLLNFIIGDKLRKTPPHNSAILGVRAQYYTQGGAFIYADALAETITLGEAADINTFKLYLQDYIYNVIQDYGTPIGIVKLCVTKDGIPITDYLEFSVRPGSPTNQYSPLHDENTFIFLNALGGWDAYNFDATDKEEIRPDTETYNKTVTPQTIEGQKPISVETVHTNDAQKVITIEGAPVSKDIGEWLQEMVKSKVIYHKNKYVLVQEFNVTDNPDNASMVIPTIKFKYSDSWQL